MDCGLLSRLNAGSLPSDVNYLSIPLQGLLSSANGSHDDRDDDDGASGGSGGDGFVLVQASSNQSSPSRRRMNHDARMMYTFKVSGAAGGY